MNAPRRLLSIVCPVYQEEAALPRFHAGLMRVLQSLHPQFDVEVVYVEDGSTDDTQNILRRLAAEDARVRYLMLSRNFGHQPSLLAGLRSARGDLVIMMDADLQHPPELIPMLLDHWRAGADVVNTVRRYDVTVSPIKRFLSSGFYRMMRQLSRTKIRESAADFRLMSRRALDALLQLGDAPLFLRGMVEWVGFLSAEVSFVAPPRAAGRSKYTLCKQVALAVDGMVSFSRVPLRLALTLGLLLLTLGLICGGVFAGRWLAGRHDGAQMGLFLCVECCVGGAILLCLGIIGEYIGRIFEQVQGRPPYLIREAGNIPHFPSRACRSAPGRLGVAIPAESFRRIDAQPEDDGNNVYRREAQQIDVPA
jgi:glycosyltransferase involved in cell wall biosynthesis